MICFRLGSEWLWRVPIPRACGYAQPSQNSATHVARVHWARAELPAPLYGDIRLGTIPFSSGLRLYRSPSLWPWVPSET